MFQSLVDNLGEAQRTFSETAQMRGLSLGQVVFMVVGLTGMVWAAQDYLATLLGAAVLTIQLGFLVCAAWRVLLVVVSLRPLYAVAAPDRLPTYTVLVALYDEVDVMEQLVERLSRIDYPSDLLQGMILVEAHDLETLHAAQIAPRPDWLKVVIVPPGSPMTKPRALNHGLGQATGHLLTVYDAEDDPHPLQLREGAARFAADPDGRLACLQAPLRIRRLDRTIPQSAFLHRQFAVEYAALFEVTLPAMARMGLPFPLGGTSNHFRTEVLREVAGWDAHNVTEDADLGFRLWRNGWRQGVMTSPTFELPPDELEHWLPQRTRWLKGFMQTWGVHTRSFRGLGLRGGFALVMTLGATIASASAHALSLAWLAASVLISVFAGMPPETPVLAVSVMVLGVAAAWVTGRIGVQRAGLTYNANDMIMSPIYWSLLSLALVHAVWRLIREPFVWNKTRHRPDPIERLQAISDRWTSTGPTA